LPAATLRRPYSPAKVAVRRLFSVVVLACAALAVVVSPAEAHNVLSGSDPKNGAELAKWPADVLLEFDQPVRQGFTQVTVTGPEGARFDRGEPSVSRTKVRMTLADPGPAGEYVIGYRILSSDGHPVAGKVTFTLSAAGAAPAATATPTPGDTDQATDQATAPTTVAPPAGDGPGAADGPGDGDLSAQATEAAQTGGAGMAVVWIVGAIVLLGGATVVAMRKPPTPIATPSHQTPSTPATSTPASSTPEPSTPASSTPARPTPAPSTPASDR
jgi:methionine-rich copper-binding protein CopC